MLTIIVTTLIVRSHCSTDRDFLRDTGGGSCFSRGGTGFSVGLLDFAAGDALPEELAEPELLDELEDRDDDPLLDDDLDLLPDELADPLRPCDPLPHLQQYIQLWTGNYSILNFHLQMNDIFNTGMLNHVQI